MNDLILPILVSSAACLVISILAWGVLPIHAREHLRLPTEPELLEALRRDMPKPGIYSFPYRGVHGANNERHDVAANLLRGPVGYIVIGKSGPRKIAGSLAQHFLFLLVVATLTAYIATISGLKDGAPFDKVFRIVAIVSTMTLVLGTMPLSIWFSRPWKSFALQLIEGLACGLTTGAVFGWLWPL
jgi:hypothetical protein